MTLNITVAAPWVVYQSSDLRVTHGTRIEDDASPKQVSVSVQGWHALIGYTGLAELEGKRTHEWLSELVTQIGNEDFDVLIEAIREAATRALRHSGQPDRRHCFAVGATTGERAKAVLISNFQERSGTNRSRAADEFYFRVLEGHGVHVLPIGSGAEAVSRADKRLLKKLVRKRGPPTEMLSVLAEVNGRASKLPVARGTVSQACVAGYLLPDGSGATRRFGEVKTEFLPRSVIGGVDMTKLFVEALDGGRLREQTQLAACERFTSGRGWTPVPEMASARAFHSATRLSDGRVLLAGGRAKSGSLFETEIYNPERDGWTQAAPMFSARAGHQAALLRDGRVLVVGGFDADALCEVYDPLAGNWSRTGKLNVGRSNHALVVLPDGLVLAIGGTGTDGRALSSTEYYDPMTGGWQVGPELRQPRYQLAVSLLTDGSVLVIGGNKGTNPDPVLRSCERLTALDQAWTSAEPMAEPRHLHVVAPLPGGSLLVMGRGSVGSSEIYSVSSGTWRRGDRMAVGRIWFTATRLDEESILVCGGQRAGDGFFVAESECFDAAAGSWLAFSPMAAARAQHTATLLDDGTVLVAGGTSWGQGAYTRRPGPLQFVQSALTSILSRSKRNR